MTNAPAANAAQPTTAAVPTTSDPAFVVGQRYFFVHFTGDGYIYDYRGIKQRGKHAGCHHFEHRQKKNWLGDMYLRPGHPDLPRIQIYVPLDNGGYKTIPNNQEKAS